METTTTTHAFTPNPYRRDNCLTCGAWVEDHTTTTKEGRNLMDDDAQLDAYYDRLAQDPTFKLGDKVQTIKSGRTGVVAHTYREFDGTQSMCVKRDDTGAKGQFRAQDVEFLGTPRTPRNLPRARAW